VSTVNVKPSVNSNEIVSPFIKLFSGLSLFFLILNIAVGYLVYNRWVAGASQTNLSQLSQTYAEQQANVVTSYIEKARNDLRGFTRRTVFSDALADNNEAILARTQTRIRQEVSDIETLSVFRAGSAQADDNSLLSLSFAQIDMINRAERREIVAPEAGKINDEWKITFVEAIPYLAAGSEKSDTPTKPVVGTILAGFNLIELKSLLTQFDTSLGQIELLQQFPNGKEQSLFSIGDASEREGLEIQISDSFWRIRFTPSIMVINQSSVSPIWILLLLVVSIAACIAASYFTAQAYSRYSINKQMQTATISNATEASKANIRGRNTLDVVVSEEDTSLLGLKHKETDEDPLEIRDKDVVENNSSDDISAEIFRSYDIRGVVDSQLTPRNVVLIGQAIGSQAIESGEKTLVIGRDGRTHSNDISEQLIEGILTTGCDVINIGMVPTPLVYYAICESEISNSGVMVTASHNPSEYNGFKIVINNETLCDQSIQQIRSRIVQSNFTKGSGKEDFSDVSFQYIERIISDVALAGELSVVIDAGNGVAGDIAPRLLSELGCNVTPLYCEVDGEFPNHQPDPSVIANLDDLINKVKEVGADIGIAFDGDGDRLGVVTATGKIILPDRLLMLLAKDIVSRNPGADVIFDVKSSRDLNKVVSSYGGRPIMWKTGHSHMKAKMKETNALLGGELSGHIFIKERWYGFDDGLYAAARILEIMSLRDQDLDGIFESFPSLPCTPEIKVPIAEDKKFELIKKLIASNKFDDGRITTIDGLRVDFPEGWGLVRASNTSAAITLRFEADMPTMLTHIQDRFKQALLEIDPELKLNF